jgi:CCR4-NOT transcription complex subunit 3
VCEKEAKTKMFSKEGLAREQKVDPKEAAKNKTRDWVGNFITSLNTQMESFDADLERLSAGKGALACALGLGCCCWKAWWMDGVDCLLA